MRNFVHYFVITNLLLLVISPMVHASVRVIIPEDLPVVYNVDVKTGCAEAAFSYSSATADQLNREEVYIHDEVELDGISYPVTSLCNGFYDLYATGWELKKPVSPKSVRLPVYLETIGDRAFYRCEELCEVFIPSKVRKLGDTSFLWASSLKWIFNASKLLKLGDRYGLGGAKNAIVCQVDTIGQTSDFRYYIRNGSRYLFDLPETSHLVIPEGYQPGLRLCYNWKTLKSVSLPSDIEIIDKEAFYGCENLEKVDGLEHVLSIGESAFRSCSNLHEVSLSPQLRRLDSFAFSSCSNLNSIVLSDSLKTLGRGVFINCASLTSVHLPQHLSVLPSALFDGCSSLKDILLPQSLQLIDSQCFEGCHSLTSIQLPDSLKEIRFMAFHGCKSLKELRIPEQVTTLEYMCFKGCESMEQINLGPNFKKIGTECFADCRSLRYLICDAIIPPSANNSCFSNIPFYKCEVYVPTTSVDDYRKADGWQSFSLFNEEWDLAIDDMRQDVSSEAPAFDVMGRKLDPAHSRKGITIQNGRIRMIR